MDTSDYYRNLALHGLCESPHIKWPQSLGCTELLMGIIPFDSFGQSRELTASNDEVIALAKLSVSCKSIRSYVLRLQPAYILLYDGVKERNLPNDWRVPICFDSFMKDVKEEMERRERLREREVLWLAQAPTPEQQRSWWAAQMGMGCWRYDFMCHVTLITGTRPEDGCYAYFETLSQLKRLRTVTFVSPDPWNWDDLQDFTQPFDQTPNIEVGWVLSSPHQFQRTHPFIFDTEDGTGPIYCLELDYWVIGESIVKLMVLNSGTLTSVSLRFFMWNEETMSMCGIS
jgi:hypothetical protein